MPLLANLLISLFGTIGGYLVKYVSKKTALWLATATAIALAFGVLSAAVYALIQGLMTFAPPIVVTALSWFVPPQLPAIIGARFAVEVAAAVYRYQLNLNLAIAQSA